MIKGKKRTEGIPHATDHSFSGLSNVTQSAMDLGHFKARWIFQARSFSHLWCGSMLQGDYCHQGVLDLQTCLGRWFMLIGIHMNARIQGFSAECCILVRMSVLSMVLLLLLIGAD